MEESYRLEQEAFVRMNTARAALSTVARQSGTIDPATLRRAENARFGIRLYALNADAARFRAAADALRARGFALAREANSEGRWAGLARGNTIFYYNPEAQAKTAEIAQAMQEATGEPFEVKRGASDSQTRRDVLIVHWVPRTGG
jgi:hypothetical protein